MDFRAEERQHLVERSRALLGFAALFYPALYPLDRLLMSEGDANLIGLIRLGIAAVFLGCLALVRTAFGQRHILPISLVYALLASLGICVFGLIDTPWSSPYFVGLIMVMFGACLFLPWSLGPAAFFCGASIGIWGLANLAAEPFSLVGAGPAIFLAGSAVIAVLATHLNTVGRWRRFETGRKLAELTEARTRFFANVSHELRTPLMLLLGPIQELRERQDDPLLQAMESNARRLQRQVELLLDTARLEDGRVGVHARHGRLDHLATSLVDAARPFAEREGIRLEIDLEPLHGRYDADHAETIVGNLLSNALKFTGAGGYVRLTGNAGPPVTLRMEDSGGGIPPELVPHIFERFLSGPGAQSGSGLGLHLSRELARLMGGDIEVETELGEGSTFTLTLPSAPEQADASEAVQARAEVALAELQPAALHEHDMQTAPLEGARILVVEDNPELRAFLAQRLGRRWEVMTAGDGVEALQMILTDPPDVVVSDVAMPRMDGLELLRRIREKEGLVRMPVVLLTARGELQDVLDGYGQGANDYVVKPFNVRELEARIDGLLRLVEVEDRLALTEDSLAQVDMLSEDVPAMVQWVQEAAGTLLGRPRRLDLQPLNLAELVEQSSAPIIMPGVVLELEDLTGGATIQADREGLGRVLEELVLAAAEAARFDDPKQERRVQVKVASATTLRILVQDDRPGAPLEMARRLLAPLRPGQATMVREMLAQHGGQVKVETHAPEGGVAFSVTLPSG